MKTKQKGFSLIELLMRILLAGVFAFFGIHTVLWFPRSVKARVDARRNGAGKGNGQGEE